MCKLPGQCTDINECNGMANCGSNALCKNLIPGYQCTCREGYQMRGNTCVGESSSFIYYEIVSS